MLEVFQLDFILTLLLAALSELLYLLGKFIICSIDLFFSSFSLFLDIFAVVVSHFHYELDKIFLREVLS